MIGVQPKFMVNLDRLATVRAYRDAAVIDETARDQHESAAVRFQTCRAVARTDGVNVQDNSPVSRQAKDKRKDKPNPEIADYLPDIHEITTTEEQIGSSWRLDETYVKVKGVWKYLYRAVDKTGATVDFLLTAKRDCKAALRFLRKAIRGNGTPEKITIDKSGANTAAIQSHNAETKAGIEIRQSKYLSNIVEQDHRAIKRQTQPMLEFKSFWSAAVTLAGVELMHMIRKGHLLMRGEFCPARQFYSLAE